jgi:50S ribosomal protein L16 3-hydroxylase
MLKIIPQSLFLTYIGDTHFPFNYEKYMKSNFLGKLSTTSFTKNYWNQKPLLIKNAVPSISSFADFNDFYDLGKDAEFETRMVLETGGEYPWQAKTGPFKSTDFKRKSLWTLICHNLELLNSDFYQLKEYVKFIPDWHFDDVMATISKKGASVGAHIDDYSVFIIQGKGRRKWLLQENPNPAYQENLDIKLLKNFKPNIEWVLEPGDMIYIPPNVAHHGISLEDSISYSIGFKSIRYKNLLDQYVTDLMIDMDDASFHDLHMPVTKDAFILEDYVVTKVYDELLKMMKDKNKFKASLIKHLSMPKNIANEESSLSEDKILIKLQKRAKFKRDIWAKFVANKLAINSYGVSINANYFCVNKESFKTLERLFSSDPDTENVLTLIELKNKELVNLLVTLIKNGVLYYI